MSWEATNWAVTQQAGSPAAKLILLLLADRADERGSCWPSQARLAEESEQSTRSVQRHIDHLISRGLVLVERRHVPGKQRVTNRYVLAIRQSDAQPDLGDNQDDLYDNHDRFYTTPVSHEPPVEPPVEEPPTLVAVHSTFDDFWRLYPRKDAKKAAERAWKAALKKRSAPQLLGDVTAFAQWCIRQRKERRHIPHPATWLNGERWLDELADDAPQGNVQSHIALVNSLWENSGNRPLEG